MAISRNKVQVYWSAAYDKTITGENNVTSDVAALTATGISRAVLCKSEMTTGTPASGDKTYFYVLPTCGDPDGAGSDEYPTDYNDGLWVATIDHYLVDPGISYMALSPAMSGCKIYAYTSGLDGGDIVTVSACILEVLSI